jgi:hypothetical protein
MSVGKARTRYARVLLGGVTAALAIGSALGGCASGGSGSTAAKPTVASLVHSMRADFEHAKSLRIAGQLKQHGSPVALDLGMLRSGDFKGTVLMNGARIQVLRSGASTYAFVSRSFFRYLHVAKGVPAGACSVICDKYLKIPASAIPNLSLSTLTGEITKNVSEPKVHVPVTVTTFAGQPAYQLSHAGQSAYFAKNGHHYLIGFRSPKQDASVTFSQWNSVPPISPPPASKIVKS